MSNDRDASATDAGFEQFAAPATSSTTIGIDNKGNMTQNNIGCRYIYGGQPQANQPRVDKENQIPALLKIIHQNTWEKTETCVGDTFTSDQFPEPDFEVHPQMVESPHFYRGGHPVVETESASSKRIPKLEVVKNPEYKKDRRFTFRKFDDITQKTLSVSSVMKKIHLKNKKLGVLGVIAQAGAGKTTCMRRWARHTMELNGISEKKRYPAGKLRRFQMVHFLDIKNIPMSEISSLQEFLFKGLFENEDSTKNAYNWVLDNQNQVAIFLDGLDQAQQKITTQDMTAVGNYGKANCSRILYNLLTRNLLPGVRIIISTREHAAASLPRAARIADIITLAGFSLDDAKKLFNAVTSTDHVEDYSDSVDFSDLSYEDVVTQATTQQSVNDSPRLATPCSSIITDPTPEKSRQDTNWDKLVEKSFALLSFITVPVFLMFTALVYNRFGQTPASITELLMKVFETLPDSIVIQSHTTEQKKENIWTTIHRLKELSYKKLNDGFVIFSLDDLKSHGLRVDDVQDLLLMVPRSRSLSHRIRGDNVFFFCHQILQEFLSACFIVEMTLKDFEVFVETSLHENHWSVVRRFVCGLLFFSSEELGKLLQISDKDKKQDILRQSLAEQLEHRGHDLELCAAIYESNDDSVFSLITEIRIFSHQLSSDGAHLIGSLMARCKKPNLLQIENCGLDNDLLHIMAKSIGYPKIPISNIHLMDHPYHFDFAALNIFLDHIDSDVVDIATDPSLSIPKYVTEDGQRCEFDWKNIQLFRLSYYMDLGISIYFRNMDDSITVTIERDLITYFGTPARNTESPSKISGTYNKKDKILKVKAEFPENLSDPVKNLSDLIRLTAVAVRWLNRCSVSVDIKEKLGTQYLDYRDLAYLTEHGYLVHLTDMDITGNRQIENILLDFGGSSNFLKYGPNIGEYMRGITSIVKMFQVKVMDLVISFRQIEDLIDQFEPLFLLLHDFKLKIHVVASCSDVKKEDIPKQFAVLKHSNVQIESFRLEYLPADKSLDYLPLWIHNLSEARVEQLFIYANSLETIPDRENLECEAQSRGIELTFVDVEVDKGIIDRPEHWRDHMVAVIYETVLAMMRTDSESRNKVQLVDETKI